MNKKELSAQIEKLRRELKDLISKKNRYSDPDVLAKSRELDLAINALMRLHGENNEHE